MSVIRFTFFTVFVVITVAAASQVTVISGIISDKNNDQPLPYAQVAVAGKMNGTCSNEDGRFNLIVPSATNSDTLYFSYLGYEQVKIPARLLIGKDTVIKLVPRMILLPEVEISSLTPEEVILRAVAGIPGNYGTDSLVLTAFIRNRKVINSRLGEFTEAILEDMKTGYFSYPEKGLKEKQKTSNIARLVKGRVISDTNLVIAMGDAGRSVGCLGCMFMNDFVEYPYSTVLDSELFKYYNFKMEKIRDAEGRKIYHIFYDQKKGVRQTLWKGELYIDGSSWAIIRITQKPSMEAFGSYEKKKLNTSYALRNKPGWIAEMPHIQITVNYSYREGRWMLSTVQNESWIMFTYPPSGEKLTINSKSEVAVTEMTTDPGRLQEFKGKVKTADLKRWDQVIGEPEDSFWASYNYLPVEKKLKESLDHFGEK